MILKVLSLLILWIGLSFSQLLIFQTPYNDAFFAVAKTQNGFCIAGRTYREGVYHALLGVEDNFFILKTESYSYTVEAFKDTCLFGAVVVNGNRLDILLLWNTGKWRGMRISTGSRSMLWYMKRVRGGYVLVGGVRDKDWDILVIKLSEELNLVWSLRLDSGAEEYAYGVTELGDKLYVVGRSDKRGNWDAFLLVVDSSIGKLVSASLIGTPKKDYLRFVESVRGEVIAVGRTEFKAGEGGFPTERDSDVMLLIFSRDGKLKNYRVWGGEGYDYGRVIIPAKDSVWILGESSSNSIGQTDGLLMELSNELFLKDTFLIGGEEIESIRHGINIPSKGMAFVGYTYSYSMDNDALLGLGLPPNARRTNFKKLYPLIETFNYNLREVKNTLFIAKEEDLSVEPLRFKRLVR